jgi:hypothetical protein
MLKPRAFRPRIENSHRADEWKRCEPYLKWLRGRRCFLSIHAPKLHRCSGKVRACHFDPWGDKGMSSKVSDSAAMPMCDGAHAEQTDDLGWSRFQRKYAFGGRDVVTAYWLEWSEGTPMGVAWIKRQEERAA